VERQRRHKRSLEVAEVNIGGRKAETQIKQVVQIHVGGKDRKEASGAWKLQNSILGE
jgi:hypothetical protein